MQRWIPSLITAVALAGSASLCQAQLSWTFNNSGTIAEWTTAEPGGMTATIAPDPVVYDGTSCMQVSMDGVTSTEIDLKAAMSSINEAGYISVTVVMAVDPNSGTENGATTSYGNLQVALQENGAWPGNAIWGGSHFTPQANSWVTYTFVIGPPYQTANGIFLQNQVDGGHVYSGPVTNYIASITVNPIPNPWLMEDFSNGSLITGGGSWDSTQDAPFYNPVIPTAPAVNETPPGSWEIPISNPNGYSGWNQLNVPSFDATRYQWIGFDIYFDGPTGGTEDGGFQFFLFTSSWSSQWVGSGAFNSSMIGKWTHFNFPCAASGITGCPSMVFQGAPGTDGGNNAITFHVDNIVLWNPVTIPSITGLTPGTPGGLQMTLDADGTANPNDQEGICSPSADNTGNNFFWINQFPATYSFFLTNCPAPAVAPSFDAHIYVCNGDTIPGNDFGYNQTYSGLNWNVADDIELHVQNGNAGGVSVQFSWKTNAPSANPSSANGAVNTWNPAGMTSMNGPWSLTFTSNTGGYVTGPNGLVGNFTMPDLSALPNFTPADSCVAYGIFKNGNTNNNLMSATFASVGESTSGTAPVYSESFSGPGLTANYAWQVAEYSLDAANRAVWVPAGTGYWVKWNATVAGWAVNSTGDLLGTWLPGAGVTYTYVDATGTNTVAAVPAASLPAGNAGFFQLEHQ